MFAGHLLSAGLALPDALLVRDLSCRGSRVRKTSRRDLPAVMAAGADGATTVSATMLLAAHAGITVFVTGGAQANSSGAEHAALKPVHVG